MISPHPPGGRAPAALLPVVVLLALAMPGPHAAAQPAPPEAPASVSTAPIPQASASPFPAAAQQPPATPTAQRWSPRKDRNTPKFLALAGLLLLWLLARSEDRRKSAGRVRRPQRSNPITPDELGHAAFHAAMDADLDQYRGLFLTGPEAAELLGTHAADAYLNARRLSVLEDALADLAARIPPGSHYVQAAVDDQGLCRIVLRLPEPGTATLALGTTVRVGRILRLQAPSVGG